LTLYKYVM